MKTKNIWQKYTISAFGTFCPKNRHLDEELSVLLLSSIVKMKILTENQSIYILFFQVMYWLRICIFHFSIGDISQNCLTCIRICLSYFSKTEYTCDILCANISSKYTFRVSSILPFKRMKWDYNTNNRAKQLQCYTNRKINLREIPRCHKNRTVHK